MGPFFIMGYQRSGTTILRERLNRYRGVCVPPESPFATWLYPEFGDWRLRDVASDRLSQLIVEPNEQESSKTGALIPPL